MKYSEWKIVNLKDILLPKGYIRGPFGSALKRNEMLSTGIPVYEQQNAIYDHREFRFYIHNEKFKEMIRFATKTNDLIISCSGTVGKVSIIKEEDEKGIISQALLLLRVNEDVIMPEYLKYFFTSKEGFNSIVSRSTGSVQVNISKKEIIEQIPLKLPPLSIQAKTVEILKNIDDKININNKLIDNLEDLISLLFKNYMDSVSNENTIYLKELADISTQSTMPEGVKKYEHYSIPAFDDSAYPVFDEGDSIKSNKYLIQQGDILLSKLNPTTKRLWYPLVITKEAICSTEFMIYRADDKFRGFVYALLDSSDFMDYIISISTGSTNSRQRCKPKETLEYKFPFDRERVIEISDTIVPVMDSIAANRVQNNKLSEIRNTLLPKLIAGEIDLDTFDINI